MSKPSYQTRLNHCVIADDVRMIRVQLARWMTELGFTITHASCGATALHAIRQSQPAIVITDIDMPHLSGIHLLQTLRQDPDQAISQIPVIVSSSLEDSGIDRLVKHFGGSAFLQKPVKKQYFAECVRALTSGNPTMDDVPVKVGEDVGLQVSSRFRRILSELSDHS